MLREAKLTRKEQEALNKSLRVSRRKPSTRNVTAQDQAQMPPYALLPLLPFIPKDWIVWDSYASKQGFLAETINAMRGNVMIESGMLLDGADFLQIPPKMTAQMQITCPPRSLLHEWIARSYDNRQAFALLMPFDVWATPEAQAMFQRFGMSAIVLSRPIRFHLPNVGWKSKEQAAAWFTWSLPNLKQSITYGHIPLVKNLPEWMVRPGHKGEITKGARSMEDKLAIRQATNPHQWPAPISKGG
jgi:hypothetical protein